MNQSNKKFIKKKKIKKRNLCNNKNSNSKSKNRSNCDNSSTQNDNDKNNTSKLCYFSSVDYIVLSSTLAIALAEELSNDDLNILASFFAVLSDELALISAVDACNNGNDNNSIFVAPIPDVAVTSSKNNKKFVKKKK